jgi:replicative DNA helicase
MMSLNSEEAVLGAMIAGRMTVKQILNLGEECFSDVQHKSIYNAILELYADVGIVNQAVLVEKLAREKRLHDIGGEGHIAHLLSKTPVEGVEYYENALIDDYLRGQLQNLAKQILEYADMPKLSIGEMTNYVETKLWEVTAKKDQDKGFIPLEVSLLKTLDKLHESRNRPDTNVTISSGFTELDELLLGFQPGSLNIVIGPNGVGKTGFALSTAKHAALHHEASVVIFSLDLSCDQITRRMLALEANVDLHRLCNGNVRDEEWQLINAGRVKIDRAPIYIDDTQAISVVEMLQLSRQLKIEHGLDLVIVDYLQLVEASSAPNHNDRKVMYQVIMALKCMATMLGVPVLVLSEQNDRSDYLLHDSSLGRPDFEETAIKADVVMFMNHQVNRREEDRITAGDSDVNIFISKNRHGLTGTTSLRID